MVKHLPAIQETQVQSLGQEDSPGEGNGYPLQYSCLKNSMDCCLRSLVGDSPWNRKESDTTERLHFKQQGPTVSHRELYLYLVITYNEKNLKRTHINIYMYI